ncbi:hypothetical protein [Paramaledivibacter caminithermalis]|jgi:hypothetical protein|uniref:Uncharacterized protein n=1 Tax=Paramaledivibacter caminithermalis (strain DSM 15212 / CIP 107654 / DViRD3) TaxID=1121301 RepID=A0A1M6Q8R5_PARC5|nr:hypothetical protein [Paramaledivibacter caminithermalis]SHK16642.1 hypothetical protein SAMN02745912_02480 [Paramaledivibacter caminithermalis DSM 15212]
MLKSKFNKLLCGMLAVGMLMSTTTIGVSAIGEANVLPNGTIILENSDFDKVFSYKGDNVEEYNREMDKYLESLLIKNTAKGENKIASKSNSNSFMASSSRSQTHEISDFAIKYTDDLDMSTKFKYTITNDLVSTSEISGYSRASSSGIYGYKPDTISLTDQFTFVGVSVSVDAGGPGWSTSGESAVWSKQKADVASLTHYYEGVTCTGYDLYIKQITTGEFEVGTRTYSIIASDSTAV